MGILFNSLKEYAKKENIRFHMPGHSGENLFLKAGFDDITGYDITELSFSDNLMSPKGIIYESEKNAAKIYSSYHSLFLTSGATTGIYIALMAAKQRSNKISYFGTPHKSFFCACRVLGINYFQIQDVSEISKYKSVFITSPDYIGNVDKQIDLKLKNADTYNVLSIVDESHGSHFVFSKLLPESKSGKADIVINSLHKTLPVLTGGAIVNVKTKELYYECLEYRQILHTSSPSYLIMTSMDLAIQHMKENGNKIYSSIKKEIEHVFLNKDYSEKAYYYYKNDDFSRLVFVAINDDALQIQKYLEKHNIYIECVLGDKVVLIVTENNLKHLKYLKEVLDSYCSLGVNSIDITTIRKEENSTELYLDKKLVNIEDSFGMISALEIGIYPPGIPILKHGEIITYDIINMMIKNKKYLFGLIEGKILVKV